jgi:hypothetical protein
MKKHLGFVLAGVGLVAGAFAARASFAGEEREPSRHGFSDRTLKGWWGFNTEVGWVVPPAAPTPIPTAAVGRIYFDGEGGCQVENIINTNGESKTLTSSSCTYAVASDGTGTSEAVLPGFPVDSIPVAFVIIDGGRELRLLTTKHIVGTFSARRQ